MKSMKKWIAVLLAVLMLAAFAGCAAKKESAKEVDLREKLDALIATEEELGIDPAAVKLDDLTGGGIDSSLIGVWKTANESAVYTFGEDGVMTAEVAGYGEANETNYTCLLMNDQYVLCDETKMASYPEDSDEPVETPVLSYFRYAVDRDALYLVSVETKDEMMNSYQTSLQIFYHADETGSIAASVAKNPISLKSLFGTWETDKGTIEIGENGLTLDGETYAVSINEPGKLTAEKDGASTSYVMGFGYGKTYTGENNEEVESEGPILSLSYEGKDETDKPNLLAVLDDWNAEYGMDGWRYSATFKLAQ